MCGRIIEQQKCSKYMMLIDLDDTYSHFVGYDMQKFRLYSGGNV